MLCKYFVMISLVVFGICEGGILGIQFSYVRYYDEHKKLFDGLQLGLKSFKALLDGYFFLLFI